MIHEENSSITTKLNKLYVTVQNRGNTDVGWRKLSPNHQYVLYHMCEIVFHWYGTDNSSRRRCWLILNLLTRLLHGDKTVNFNCTPLLTVDSTVQTSRNGFAKAGWWGALYLPSYNWLSSISYSAAAGWPTDVEFTAQLMSVRPPVK